MEDNKQTRGSLLSWSLIGVAFIVIIVLLLIKFVSDGKKMATGQSRDKLINFTSAWAGLLTAEADSAKKECDILADIIAQKNIPFAKEEACFYAKVSVDKSDFSHVFFCKEGRILCDETGARAEGPDVSVFQTEEAGEYAVLKNGEGYMLAVSSPVGDNGNYIVGVVDFSYIQDLLKSSFYEDSSFLAIVTKDGKTLGCFKKFKDLDSMYLSNDNMLADIAQGAENKDYYNSFKVNLYNDFDCSIKSAYQGDVRTISFSPLGIEDWYLAFGVREAQVDKLDSSAFSLVKSTVIKLSVVLVVFAIFAFTSFIFNSLKTKERGKVLEDKADTDLLTELNNKAATERKIQEYLDDNPNGRAMMFILDIDNFKKINDTMGHAFGDTLLKTLGREIKTEFRMTDIIGRTGGDEFMVFLKDVTDDLIVEREANRITRFFHDFKAGGDYVKYSASASIGAAIYPDDAKNFKDLYVAADQALYRAKKRGKNQLVFYNEAGHQ